MNWGWFTGILVGTLICNMCIDVIKYLIKKYKKTNKKGEK